MSERRPRGRNGAAKRYKGQRDLVGARVPFSITDRVDEVCESFGLTRNDFLFSAILVAFERPNEIRAAAATLDDIIRQARAEEDQLRLADEPPQEELKRTA